MIEKQIVNLLKLPNYQYFKCSKILHFKCSKVKNMLVPQKAKQKVTTRSSNSIPKYNTIPYPSLYDHEK